MEFVVTTADVKMYVVAFRFDPVDVFRRDEQYSFVPGNRQPAGVYSRRRKSLQAGYDPVHFVAVELPSNAVLGAGQSALKPLSADRLKQIVNGISRPMSQPYLVPVRPRVSRKTHSSGVLGATSTRYGSSFTVIAILVINHLRS